MKRQPTPGPHHDDETRDRTTVDDLLDEPLAAAPTASSAAACLLGECIDPRHPTLRGRILVRWDRGGIATECWVATLQGLPVRAGDRVLLMQPANAAEPLVTGVVDGFARRPEPERDDAAVLELARDRAVRVVGSDGRALLELFEGDLGPVVRLLHDDLEIATKGRLRLRAKHVQVEAEQGQVEVKASDDVIVRGEVIHLN